MIALIDGTVESHTDDHVVINCNGIGYRLAISAQTAKRVPAHGERFKLHSHLIVRDDALQLYGFSSQQERELFLLLIGVQSVGPKVALAVLSGGSPTELLSAVAAGDKARLQAVPGVGKRTAERIIVELRERVEAAVGETAFMAASDEPRLLARDGLVELGFSMQEATSLISAAKGETAEQIIAASLQKAKR